MDIKTIPYHTPDGDYEITVTVCSFATNGRLAVNLLYKNNGYWEPFAFPTENLPRESLQVNEAFIKDFDENKGILDFILQNQIGTLCPELDHSVFYTYPKVAFNMEKLREFDPEGVEKYLRKAQQKNDLSKERRGKS